MTRPPSSGLAMWCVVALAPLGCDCGVSHQPADGGGTRDARPIDATAGSDAGLERWCLVGDGCTPCRDDRDPYCGGCLDSGGSIRCGPRGGDACLFPIPCPPDLVPPDAGRPDAGSPEMCVMHDGCSLPGGPEQVCVPGGIFEQGSDEPGHEDAAPARRVYVSPFWMDRTEVTLARFRACVEAGYCNFIGTGVPLDYIRDRANDPKPLYNLAVEPMIGLCAWEGGRLPTEAEWERAARGDDGRTYPWGDETGCAYANWAGCNDDVMPVGSFPEGASPYGILDMIGNVAEVTSDEWAEGGYSEYWPPLAVCDPAFPHRGEMFQFWVGRGCGFVRVWTDPDGAQTMAACSAFDRYSGGGFAETGWRCARDGVPR